MPIDIKFLAVLTLLSFYCNETKTITTNSKTPIQKQQQQNNSGNNNNLIIELGMKRKLKPCLTSNLSNICDSLHSFSVCTSTKVCSMRTYSSCGVMNFISALKVGEIPLSPYMHSLCSMYGFGRLQR